MEAGSLAARVRRGSSHPAEQVSPREISASTPGLPSNPPLLSHFIYVSLASHTDPSLGLFIACHFLLYTTSPSNSHASLFPASSLLSAAHCICFILSSASRDRAVHPGSVLTSTYEAAGCSDRPRQHVVYVEHVVVRVTITHGRRGDLSITLTSPSGTVSQLLANR